MMGYNPFTLQGKTIFVTGASSGIGRATAIECSMMGAKMVISGRDKDRLQDTYNQLEGDSHLQIVADLSNHFEIQSIIEFLPQLHGVVHCAGFTKSLPIQFVNEKILSEIMQVNFTAPTLITQGLYKQKKLIKNSSVVFISSISGVYCSYISGGMYSASKGAINGIVKAMAIEFGVRNIRVNTVCPGMIHTAILDAGVVSEEQLLEDMKKYPLKRYGEPSEVAYAVIYLLSDAAKWVTGSNLLIDGGYTLL